MLNFSRVEAVKQIAADLHCLLNYQTLQTSTIVLESFRFAWSPVLAIIGIVSSAGLLFAQHVIVAIASLPNCGDVDASKSQFLQSIVAKYPMIKPLLSLLLFSAASIYYSALIALAFCFFLFLFQRIQSHICAKREHGNETRRKKSSPRKTHEMLHEESSSESVSSAVANGTSRSSRTRRTASSSHTQRKF